MNKIQLFENQKIRTAWDAETEEWYFSVQDIVAVLTESADVKQYVKRMLSRDTELKSNWGTICTLVEMQAADGKKRKVQAATMQGMFRIIQSIPSPKAEPFKIWMAEVAKERIDQVQNPELSIEQAMRDYRRLGYSEEWINTRLQSIQFRKELTDQWKKAGVKEGLEYAILTNLMTKEWSGKTVVQYKTFKGLKKENLRDNMTNIELALNILAEASASEISKAKEPDGFEQSQNVALEGAKVAKDARKNIERRTGKPAISPLNAKALPGRMDNNMLTEYND
ncbi:MAG: hypothetical protein LBU83_02245 [Bacteroidales bacterium]|jgi:prophage antirepressor-like protein|nr:hypothetical protein [Bacteroidales bacterium]